MQSPPGTSIAGCSPVAPSRQTRSKASATPTNTARSRGLAGRVGGPSSQPNRGTPTPLCVSSETRRQRKSQCQRMRAVQIIRFGGAEVLDVVHLPDPVPGDGEVLYDISSSGVNYADTHH